MNGRDRVIVHYPVPYSKNCTPYKNVHFKHNQFANLGGMRLKVVVAGDVHVGKTSLILRFSKQAFSSDYKATIGVDFEVVPLIINSCPIKLQIWDTAGQERFRCISAAYYKGAQVLVLVFDMSDLSSLHRCQEWRKDALERNKNTYNNNDNSHGTRGSSNTTNNKHNCDIRTIFLVGTKTDLLSRSEFALAEKEASIMACKLNAELSIVSSKTGEGVEELFARVSVLALEAVDTSCHNNVIHISNLPFQDVCQSKECC